MPIRFPANFAVDCRRTVVRSLRKPGEPIAAGDAVVELEADQSSIVLDAPQAGVLVELLAQAGPNRIPSARCSPASTPIPRPPAKLRRKLWPSNQVPRAARSCRS